MNRGFSSVHPFVSFIYYLILITLTMLLLHPVYLLLSIFSAIIFNILRDAGKTLLKSLGYYLLMGTALIVINPLINHRGRRVLFYISDNPITLEAIVYGSIMALSLISILINFVSLQQVVNYHKFLYLFSSLLPRLSFLVMMTIRFIPLLRMRLGQISAVQKTRGIDLSTGSVIKRIKSGMLLLNILLTWSLEEALQTADSMKARGYGVTKRSSYLNYRMSKRDWGLLALILSLSALVITGWAFGKGVLKIYPVLGNISLKPQDIFFYLVFLILTLVPVIEEGKEIFIWRSLK